MQRKTVLGYLRAALDQQKRALRAAGECEAVTHDEFVTVRADLMQLAQSIRRFKTRDLHLSRRPKRPGVKR